MIEIKRGEKWIILKKKNKDDYKESIPRYLVLLLKSGKILEIDFACLIGVWVGNYFQVLQTKRPKRKFKHPN